MPYINTINVEQNAKPDVQHTRTLAVSVSRIDVLVMELVTGSVSARQLQVPGDDQQGAQQREHVQLV